MRLAELRWEDHAASGFEQPAPTVNRRGRSIEDRTPKDTGKIISRVRLLQMFKPMAAFLSQHMAIAAGENHRNARLTPAYLQNLVQSRSFPASLHREHRRIVPWLLGDQSQRDFRVGALATQA